MTKRVLIIGAAGIIGSVLRKYLKEDYKLILVDKVSLNEPNFLQLDVANDYQGLKQISNGRDAVVHLGWTKYPRENFETGLTAPENKVMIENVYKAALETIPHPRVIMASSVHAVGGYVDWTKEPYSLIARREFDKIKEPIKLITVDQLPFPNSPYGVTKVYLEALGKYYSTLGLSVICIRFGGVNPEDKMIDEVGYHSVWLSHRDCVQLIRKCIEVKDLPPFSIFFGVSNNKYRIHDILNAQKSLGYEPEDDAEKFYSKK